MSIQMDEDTVYQNYGPVSNLPVFSKIYGRYMFDQMHIYFNQFLSEDQSGLYQSHSLLIIKKLKYWAIVV